MRALSQVDGVRKVEVLAGENSARCAAEIFAGFHALASCISLLEPVYL